MQDSSKETLDSVQKCLQTKSDDTAIVYSLSAPKASLHPVPEVEITRQTSAPFYLFSLKENESLPFRKPDAAPRPVLIIGTIMDEDEAIQMIDHTTRGDGKAEQYMSDFVVKKGLTQNYNLQEKKFLVSLLKELIDYAAQRDFSSFKLACMITLYLNAHKYFKRYYWLLPNDLWDYFKELMIRHTVEDSPDGQEVFEPEECYDILSHFHTIYMNNLPLIHTVTFGVHRIKFTWPFHHQK